jgi:hypothetical protein
VISGAQQYGVTVAHIISHILGSMRRAAAEAACTVQYDSRHSMGPRLMLCLLRPHMKDMQQQTPCSRYQVENRQLDHLRRPLGVMSYTSTTLSWPAAARRRPSGL